MVRTVWTVGAVVVLLMTCLAGGCGRPAGEGPREPGPVRVVVSIPPLAGLVEPLLPEGAELRVLVAPGSSPHGYEPSPSDIAAIARADLVVLVGMGTEAGLPASAKRGDRVLTMGEALGIDQRAAIDDHDHGAHDHDHGAHDHAHSGPNDPHLWLDPQLVGAFVPLLAERVAEAVEAADGAADQAGVVASRSELLSQEIAAVDLAYQGALRPLQGAAIVTQHGAWSRLTDRYGLEIAGVIQIADGGEPTPGHIAEVVASAKEHHARAVFTEVQLDARLAERVARQLGVPVGRLDPLGQGDWVAMMRENLAQLTGAMEALPAGDASEGE